MGLSVPSRKMPVNYYDIFSENITAEKDDDRSAPTRAQSRPGSPTRARPQLQAPPPPHPSTNTGLNFFQDGQYWEFLQAKANILPKAATVPAVTPLQVMLLWL